MTKKIERFEDFEVWQESINLCIEIYKNLKECRDFSLRDQIQRASVSIPSNIAEGYERQSNKEFIHFLYIAKGSCGELRTQIHIAIEINLIDKNIGKNLLDKTKRISAMLHKLIKTREEKF